MIVVTQDVIENYQSDFMVEYSTTIDLFFNFSVPTFVTAAIVKYNETNLSSNLLISLQSFQYLCAFYLLFVNPRVNPMVYLSLTLLIFLIGPVLWGIYFIVGSIQSNQNMSGNIWFLCSSII